MAATLLAVIALLLWFVLRVLNINSQCYKPKIICQDTNYLTILMKFVPTLDCPYVPTQLWGFNGHFQTVLHSVVGRVKCPWPIGERCEVKLQDGSTITFDIYQAFYKIRGNVTIMIVPGIGNSSETVYIRTFVHYAQYHGYRCAVLNHTGALKSVSLTAPRVFTYGHTDDLRVVLKHLTLRYPTTKIVCVGYSMGGNLVTKYLGECLPDDPKSVIGGMSICQGYDIIEGTKYLLQWQNLRRIYLYLITEAVKGIILRHREILLSDQAKEQYGLVEKSVFAAATLPELDDAYTIKVHQFRGVPEFYRWSSSINYVQNIKVPMLFINALDDPLVPEVLLPPIRNIASTQTKMAYIELTHGGHLGFFEGGVLYPSTISWLDRTLISSIAAIEEAASVTE